MFMRGALLGVALAVCLPLSAEPGDVFALVKGNCASCHNASVKSGDLDLASLHSPKTFEEDRETWARVVERLPTAFPAAGALPRSPMTRERWW